HVRASYVRAARLVALAAVEREVVGEDVRALVELDVALAVVPGRVVAHGDAARVAVEGDAVFLVAEGNRALDGVVDLDVIAPELEAVAVAVGGRTTGAERPVHVGHAVL